MISETENPAPLATAHTDGVTVRHQPNRRALSTCASAVRSAAFSMCTPQVKTINPDYPTRSGTCVRSIRNSSLFQVLGCFTVCLGLRTFFAGVDSCWATGFRGASAGAQSGTTKSGSFARPTRSATCWRQNGHTTRGALPVAKASCCFSVTSPVNLHSTPKSAVISIAGKVLSSFNSTHRIPSLTMHWSRSSRSEVSIRRSTLRLN